MQISNAVGINEFPNQFVAVYIEIVGSRKYQTSFCMQVVSDVLVKGMVVV